MAFRPANRHHVDQVRARLEKDGEIMPSAAPKAKLSNSFLRHRNTQKVDLRPEPAPEAVDMYKERGNMSALRLAGQS